jgi:V8-like Glu-specific endopeptidase
MIACHVVYIKNRGGAGRDGWVRSIDFMPGRNGTSLPYGTVRSSNFRSVVGWTNNGDQNFDYGAIIIPTDLGKSTGWFGFGVFSDSDLLNSIGNISGYPGDKPVGTQWMESAERESLREFLESDRAIQKKNRYKYQIDGREVDFSPAVPLQVSNNNIPVWLAKNLGLLKIVMYQALPAIRESMKS